MLLSGSRKSFDVARAFAIILSIGIVLSPLSFVLMAFAEQTPREAGSEFNSYLVLGLSCLLFVWWAAAVASLGARLLPLKRLSGAVGFVVATMLSGFLLPSSPVVSTTTDFAGFKGLIEYAFDFGRPPQTAEDDEYKRVDVESTYARQPRLVSAELDRLLPSREGRGELYFVSFGAYAEQNVFLRESMRAREIVDERMGTEGRSLLLVNNRDTVESLPLANITNLELVMNRLGHLMDPEKDVLVLFLTSHGWREALSVSFGGFSFNDLTPGRLREILDQSGIRHRVVIVSACHSGAFIPALEGKNTIVITAASAERSSFGCSNEREWTYFGDAFFNHALRETRSFVEAFALARSKVFFWEKREGYTASDPQISAGEDAVARLQKITAALEATATSSGTGSDTPPQTNAANVDSSGLKAASR